MSLARATNRIVDSLPWFALAVVALVAGWFPASDPDVFFHLAAGRDIAAAGGVPRVETLTALSAGRAFLNHEWLFDALLWGAFAVGGPAGTTVLQAVLLAALALLVARLGVRLGARPWVAVGAMAACLPLVRGAAEPRPWLAGCVLAAGLCHALLDAEAGRRRGLVMAPVLVAAWANVHGSFPLAFGLWAARLVPALIRRPADVDRRALGLAGLLMAPAWLANPWGPSLLGVVWHHAAPVYRDLIPEWRSIPWGETPARDALMLAWVAVPLLSFLPRPNRSRLQDLGLLLCFLVPAATSVKFLLGLPIGAVPVAAGNLARAHGGGRRGRVAAAIAIAGALALAPLAGPPFAGGAGFDLDEYPVVASADLDRAGFAGTVFAPFHLGGFLEHANRGAVRPWIDGRAYVHGLEGVRTYLGALAEPASFEALRAAGTIDAVLVDLHDPSFPRLAAHLAQRPGWDLVSLDDRFALYVVADGRARPGLEPYRVLKATTDPRWLSGLPPAALAAAVDEASRVASSGRGEVMGGLVRGVARLGLAGAGTTPEAALRPGADVSVCREALEDFDRLAARRPDVAMFRYFRALALACAGERDGALAALAPIEAAFPDAGRLAGLLRDGAGGR